MSDPAALLERPVAKDKPKRDDRAVKIERDLAVMMNFIVDSKSTGHSTVAEYLSAICRATVERDYRRAQEHFNRRKKAEGGVE